MYTTEIIQQLRKLWAVRGRAYCAGEAVISRILSFLPVR